MICGKRNKTKIERSKVPSFQFVNRTTQPKELTQCEATDDNEISIK